MALVAGNALPGLRVVRELCLARLIGDVRDNGPELTGMTVLRFSQERQIEWRYIAPGKLPQNAFIEFQRSPDAPAMHAVAGFRDPMHLKNPV